MSDSAVGNSRPHPSLRHEILKGQTMLKTIGVLVARLIFAGMFAMAAGFKYAGMSATAAFIAAAGFPASLMLAWLAALLETALTIAFVTGAFFRQAACIAAAYVLFLAFAFHGP